MMSVQLDKLQHQAQAQAHTFIPLAVRANLVSLELQEALDCLGILGCAISGSAGRGSARHGTRI